MKLLVYFFKTAVPKYIKLNDFDEHKYLLPVFLFIQLLLLLMIILLKLSNEYFLLMLLPVIYYVYLTFALISNEYDFDRSALSLSSEDGTLNLFCSITSVYQNKIVFYLHKMTKDNIASVGKSKDQLVKEISSSLAGFNGTLALQTGYLYEFSDLSVLDIEFFEMLVRSLNIKMTEADYEVPRKYGVELSV